MEKLIVNGGKKLQGTTSVSGAKNVALKALVAACLTDDEVVIENVPLISDVAIMCAVIEELGGNVTINGHTFTIHAKSINKKIISLEKAAEIRTSAMFVAPLLVRFKEAIIPNPGGCRIGARPIDRIVEGLKKMNVAINYDRTDGYFHAKIAKEINNSKELQGVSYRFEKNSHTGTETLILAAVLAKGITTLENASAEPEVDQLIAMLNNMGASIKRTDERTIVIHGASKLHGAHIAIGPDRNEIVTLAVAAIVTGGNVFIKGAKPDDLTCFLETLDKIHGGYKVKHDGIRFFNKGELLATHITTSMHPGIMTDWQGPLAVLLTQAKGTSTIHETVYENRFGYVKELLKMGANIELFNPKLKDPDMVYNFNMKDNKPEYFHAAEIIGSTPLHDAVLTMTDIRAGATIVLAALAAKGQSTIFNISFLDRGYEAFEKRLQNLGADIKRVKE